MPERNLEIDKQIVKILYGNDTVFNDDEFRHPLMASSIEEFDLMAKSGWLGRDCSLVGEKDIFCLKTPEFSCRIELAFFLVEYMHESLCFIKLCYENDGTEWYCHINDKINDDPFTSTVYIEVEADTAPMAICKAFLKYHELTNGE